MTVRKNKPDQDITHQDLVLHRTFDASRELVFKAWTDPRHVARWWGPSGFTSQVHELDPRPGGRILIHLHGPDGEIYPVKGVFDEVVSPERLVFTTTGFEDDQGNPQLEVRHTVTLVEQGGRTALKFQARVIKALPGVADVLSEMEAGWSQGLDRLAESLL